MNYFDMIVQQIISQNQEYTTLRNVIEKEIIHRDILHCMNQYGYLKKLTFMGGTCLRDCYGSQRMSEDLDFTGGFDFDKSDMRELGQKIKQSINDKYQFPVTITEPTKEDGNTQTWKIKIITRPEQSDFPTQKINIDICMLPSHDRKVSAIKNIYNINTAADGLLLYAESLSEILCDKLIAFARRPNRVKNRDLWDIHWLSQKNITINKELLLQKLDDRKITAEEFRTQYYQRIEQIRDGQKNFLFEMKRFLTPSTFSGQFCSQMWWEYLLNMLSDFMN